MIIQERIRDAAVKQTEDRSRRRLLASDILRLSSRETMGDLIEVEIIGGEPASFVAEVTSRHNGTEETLYAIAVRGSRIPERFYNIDCALLALVAYRHNNANMNDRGWSFAARALGVTTEAS